MNKQNLTKIFILFLELALLINFPIAISSLLGKSIGIVSADESNLQEALEAHNPFWWNETYNNTNYFSASNSIANLTWNCCPMTKNNAICQNIAESNSEACAVTPIPTSCENYDNCKIGCCIDESEGLCTTQSPKRQCLEDGGVWKDERNCLIPECERGCCVLGDRTFFSTEKRCEKLSQLYGFEEDFRDITSEIECLELQSSQAQGACILTGNSCRFLPQAECLRLGGEFNENYLCSNPELNTSCEKQSYIGCVEGKDEIYWFDSCGNRENIYSSDRDASWNNGFLLEKNQSCNPDQSNANSKNCGNCNIAFGSFCSETDENQGVVDGNYICKDLNCIDEKGHQRLNGESWCSYDAYIGDGKDPAGSRHWRKICVDGNIVTEPCADYRGQICTQTTINGDSGKKYTMAQCSMNSAFECIDYNSASNMEQLCKKNEDCVLKNVDIDSDFKFKVCVGKYPRGFDFNDANNDAAKEVCGLATQTCKVVYKKDWKGHWKCIKNCDCRKKEFSVKMNDLCISLGDCGTYINYIGDGTNNVKIEKAPQISWQEYTRYANPVEGRFAKPRNISDILKKLQESGDINEEDYPQESDALKAAMLISKIPGAAGMLLQGIQWVTGKTVFYASGYGFFSGSSSTIAGTGVTNILSAVGNAATGLSIGMIVGGFLAQWRGLTGTGAMVAIIASGIAVGTAFLAYTQGVSLFSMNIFSAIFWPALAIAIYAFVVGWGKIKIVKVKFTCMPWQPPVNGNNCHRCNEDPSKPCSKYRCESLGTACRLLNEDEQNPICEAIEDDGKPPKISPESIQQGYGFFHKTQNRVEIRTSNQRCIPEFTPISLVLGTDEYAQCKFSFEDSKSFDDMEQYFLEENSFSKNHTLIFSIPSLDSMQVYNISGDIREMFGNANLYVKCRDANGNSNPNDYILNFCINSGPDITPPMILATDPANNAILAFGTEEVFAKIYVNEPAECKYSYEDKSYSEMENMMDCETNLLEPSGIGWECNSTFNLNNDETKIYIRCRDQPWLGPYNQSRNNNTESFVYVLRKTQTPLNITSLSPEGEIKYGFEPVSVELTAETAGGVNNGESICYYRFSQEQMWSEFFDNSGNIHEQIFDMMTRGNYKIDVKCEDSAGNSDEKSAIFKISIDETPPSAVRVYKDGDDLILITNEDAKCYYTNDRCNFNLDNGNPMTTAFSTIHSTQWDTEKTYYIRCKDIWGNSNPNCAIIVRPANY